MNAADNKATDRAARHRRRWRHRALLVVLGVAALWFWQSLPEPLFTAPQAYVIVSRDGVLLGARIAADGQWRFPPLQHVPDKFGSALVAYEDKRFRQHPGVDPVAVARAARLNLTERRVVSGGSTITMQVARLARQSSDRNLHAKLRETLLALRIEASFSKDEILALYANNAPFGGNVVGLEAAAWRYFGRSPQSLSWAEACTLAVLPNSPALVHLKRNRTALQFKRDRLLRRLHEAGQIDTETLTLALAEPLTAEPRELPNLAPHLLESLRARRPDQHRFSTALDRGLQVAASELVQQHSESLALQGIHNAAAMIIDNATMEVIAYVGNSNWTAVGERGFAVDIVQRARSTGSILKPFLYAAMLEDGSLLPQMLIADVPTQYSGYVPENFDREYRGAVPADLALAQSLNVPAVRMLRRYGVERFFDLLRESGMRTLNRAPDSYGLTLILGGAEGSLWDMTSMYANLAATAQGAGGLRRPLIETSALGIETQRSTQHGANKVVATIGPAAAWLTLQALLEVARPGEESHWRSFASARQIAWKTGTSWGLRDGWALGTNSRHTVGVWVGNATGEGRPGLTGSTVAAPLLFALFNRLNHAAWPTPPYQAMKQVDVCRNDGYLDNGNCDTQRIWIPKNNHFDEPSPHNLLVHLDQTGTARVDSSCEATAQMQHRSWFVLPAAQEYYFRRQHSSYRALPSLRSDCQTGASASGRGPLDFLYPNADARIFIPLELDGRLGRTVFEAVHRQRDAVVYWHLDDQYLGATRATHQQTLKITAGIHALTVVDAEGYRATRRFEILPRDNDATQARPDESTLARASR